MQTLFSTFPRGFPGVGLLLLRAVVAIPLIADFLTASSTTLAVSELARAGAAVLVLIGLWTPLAGALIAVVQLGLALSDPAEPSTLVRVGLLGAALAMLGPGWCSVDARLFGRKQIEIPQR